MLSAFLLPWGSGSAQAGAATARLTPGGRAGAIAGAAHAACRAVIKPTEGTIRPVAREAGRAAKAAAADPKARVNTVVRAACKAAKAATDNTPTQLAILREAGVVDAGGFGLQVILEGFLKTVEESEADAPASHPRARGRAAPAQVNL